MDDLMIFTKELIEFLNLNIFIILSMLVILKKRNGYVRILEYLKTKDDYQYSIAKNLTMSIGNVYNYCKDLIEIDFISSKFSNKVGNRKIRTYSINKEKIDEIDNFINEIKEKWKKKIYKNIK